MNDLELIKKYYGEKMSHLCRTLFPTLLEQEGLLFSLIDAHFNHSKSLYGDIVSNHLEEEFKNYIYNLVDVEREKPMIMESKSPRELLSEAGYILYECKSERDIQQFKKYYAKGEELCTFNGGRLERCYVFFAVKKNVDEIKRKDFPNPSRQDAYGTSVISIQFTIQKPNIISIKNRYNHRVNNPDATFSNNLENIIPGLTKAFEDYYHLDVYGSDRPTLEIPGYVLANDGKYYKYNYEIGTKYYCPNNIIIDNYRVIRDYEAKEKYLVIDYFVLDLVNKTINVYAPYIEDSFIDGLKDIKKIDIVKDKETGNKRIVLSTKEGIAEIVIDKNNRIIGYKNDYLKSIGDSFLKYNKVLGEIYIPNVESIGSEFLYKNLKLESISLPKVQRIQNDFLHYNKKLIDLSLPEVKKIGNNFLDRNGIIQTISLPKVQIIGDDFLEFSQYLKNLSLPNVEKIGSRFIFYNISLRTLSLPKLKSIGDKGLGINTSLKYIFLPSIESIGEDFLYCHPRRRRLDRKIIMQVLKKKKGELYEKTKNHKHR